MKNKGWIFIIAILLLTFFVDDVGLSQNMGSRVALLEIKGPIMQESSGISAGSRDIANAILNAAQNNEVRAIFLDINSPGGTVGGSQEIYWALRKFRDSDYSYIDENGETLISKKVIHAYIGELGASGGITLQVQQITSLPYPLHWLDR